MQFEENANEILSLIPEVYPNLTFGFDAHFLLSMFSGKVGISKNAFGVNRYRTMIEEAEIKKRFGSDGLIIDMASALNMLSLPPLGSILENLFVKCLEGLNSSVDINHFSVDGGNIRFKKSAKNDIIRRFSHEITGKEVTQYRKFQSIADQLNDFVIEVYGKGNYIQLDTLLQVGADENGDPRFEVMPSCVPSQRAQLLAARVATGAGMMKPVEL